MTLYLQHILLNHRLVKKIFVVAQLFNVHDLQYDEEIMVKVQKKDYRRIKLYIKVILLKKHSQFSN